MQFALSEEQVAFRDAVRELLTAQCPPAVLRSAWPDGDPAGVDRLWAALVELDLPAALVPEPAGGLGLDETDLVALLEEVGHAAVPLPVAEHVLVAAPLLAAVDHPRLPDVVAGRVRVTVTGPDGLAPYGGRADLVLTLTGTAARLAPAPTGAVLPTVDGSRALVRCDDPGDLLTTDPELLAVSRLRTDLADAAQLVGLARRMLDLTVGYVGQRRQFGVPVGSFQAVKHHLAEALLRLELAVPTVRAAAWSVARRTPERDADVSAAVLLAVDAARTMARTAIQCHGAIGYTVEYDLHLYAKRTWAVAARCDPDAHLDRLAGALDLEAVPT
ncbi:acyl-CoA dehydrogenase family protein [Micromonospora echinospora]|uniref:acyl-CoA dehydrogenase family protein n=1 Tax=Micromonospora echinospora TaxID=1877 RepID=UPI003A8B219F